ncbi:MAG: hypothetical protein A2X84_03490 [Desulfuromonadaceae bacterium GWC2_58_13]|nr:MAG: hypothetical protein A2X84_03490 [Desulfuromonadaceae bacterium GWC2_58_13]
MRVLLAALAGLLLSWAPANAAEPAMDMFAFGAKLDVTGQQAFYQLELPLDLYQAVTRRDLGDIRVFNAAGQVVPHALRRPEQTSVRKDVVTSELPFFPLRGETAMNDGDLAIQVARNPQGTIIEVRTSEQKGSAATEPVRAYLVDAGTKTRPIDALELVWAEQGTDFLGEVQIETSNDLNAWRPLTSAAVARLSYQGYRLDRSRIELSRPHARYLRISWPGNRPPADVSSIIALTRQNYTTSHPQRRWLKVNALPVAGQSQSFLADLEGFPPVDTIQIHLAESNSMAAARLSSSASMTAPQQEHWRGLVYNLQADGQSVSNPAVTVPPTMSRYWTLTIDGSESALRSAPRFEFGWQPARLVFLAQGEGPFLLAYGSGNMEPPGFPLEKLLQQTAASTENDLAVAKVEPGPRFLLGGKSKLLSTTPFPWKTWLLWTVLATGVLLIGWMSLRLYRQLHDQEQSHPD